MPVPTVVLVDDDAVIREAVAMLLDTAGLRCRTHDSAESFLASWHPDEAGCLLLDICMPGMGGEALHQELRRRADGRPVIYMSAYGDVPTTVRAMQTGAMDFLTKPVNGAELVERVREALERDRQIRQRLSLRREFQDRLARLTERERDILDRALAGHSSKEIGQALGVSFRTVEAHRSHILLKTGVRSLLELAGLAEEAGVTLRAPGGAGEGPASA
ncbi:MAG: response regulator [Pseudomonadota bacterium]